MLFWLTATSSPSSGSTTSSPLSLGKTVVTRKKMRRRKAMSAMDAGGNLVADLRLLLIYDGHGPFPVVLLVLYRIAGVKVPELPGGSPETRRGLLLRCRPALDDGKRSEAEPTPESALRLPSPSGRC